MKNNVDFPEFKDCPCGARIRLAYLENPNFPTVVIGVGDCGCGDTHFVMLGPDADVRAAAEDLERYSLARGNPVTGKFFPEVPSHYSH